MEITKEEARFWQDKATLDNQVKDKFCTLEDLLILNILPDNYFRWLKEKELKTKVQANYDVNKPDKIKIIWDNELQDYEEEDKEWIIEKLIPTKSVCILTGKRGTLKTFIMLNMAYAIASGSEFLNKFSTRKGKIIYLDKENGVGIMKQRTDMIKKGMDLKSNDQVGFICFSHLKIDNKTNINQIESLIEEQKPILLIIDTYRRAISFDENDAGEVSKLFVDTLRPLVEKYDLSIVLIHHNRKGNGENVDEMDELRGSSDLPNYADSILKLERMKDKLVLKQLKNRNAQEEPAMRINSEFGDDYVKFWYDGEYLKKGKAERFEEIIIEWITTKNITEFQTKDIKDLAFEKGVKKNAMHNALMDLQSKGIIINLEKGKYRLFGAKD